MKYSFIIPTFNRADVIINTLESVIKQGFKDYEIIIVDDASTDKTRSVLFKYIRQLTNVKYFCLDKNSGANVAKNFGAKLASGEYLIFLDSDDLLESFNSLQFIDDEIIGNDNPKILMFACINIDQQLTIDNINYTGFVGYKDYFMNKFKGEYLPVVNRLFFYKSMFYEDINGGEGITWKNLTFLSKYIYLSSTVVRIYDNKGLDRLSTLNRKNYKRIRNVFIKDLQANFFIYLKLYPSGLISVLARIIYYSGRAV